MSRGASLGPTLDDFSASLDVRVNLSTMSSCCSTVKVNVKSEDDPEPRNDRTASEPRNDPAASESQPQSLPQPQPQLQPQAQPQPQTQAQPPPQSSQPIVSPSEPEISAEDPQMPARSPTRTRTRELQRNDEAAEAMEINGTEGYIAYIFPRFLYQKSD